jgi:hypothetical protein
MEHELFQVRVCINAWSLSGVLTCLVFACQVMSILHTSHHVMSYWFLTDARMGPRKHAQRVHTSIVEFALFLVHPLATESDG